MKGKSDEKIEVIKYAELFRSPQRHDKHVQRVTKGFSCEMP